MSPSESAILAAKAACWDARASLGSRRDAHRDRRERCAAQCVRLALVAVARAQRALDEAARALEAADAISPEEPRKETGCASAHESCGGLPAGTESDTEDTEPGGAP